MALFGSMTRWYINIRKELDLFLFANTLEAVPEKNITLEKIDLNRIDNFIIRY